ncbi:hypothetical protein LOAG_17855 [Loa loa]|uniref:Uncharacterized protein n=1 Tax=Loa loa TaxID=7209 RepID=A0A1I7VIP9_LOALO|nr:hypothetical protein LOAG_17855 [Loa loa]EJD74905.1 hypothetical protein LOAG_17855 [Loa loa]
MKGKGKMKKEQERMEFSIATPPSRYPSIFTPVDASRRTVIPGTSFFSRQQQQTEQHGLADKNGRYRGGG